MMVRIDEGVAVDSEPHLIPDLLKVVEEISCKYILVSYRLPLSMNIESKRSITELADIFDKSKSCWHSRTKAGAL
jgi:hypothetical protein